MKKAEKWGRFVKLVLAPGLIFAASVALILNWSPQPSQETPKKQNTPRGTEVEPRSMAPGFNPSRAQQTDAPGAAAPNTQGQSAPRESLNSAREGAATTVSPSLVEFWKKRLRDVEGGPFDSWFHEIAITSPGPDIVSCLDRIQLAKLENPPNPIAGLVTNLYEALLLVCTFVSMSTTGPPGACVEYNNTFFISGGRSTSVVTNFEAGFAIRRGEATIYHWDRKDIFP